MPSHPLPRPSARKTLSLCCALLLNPVVPGSGIAATLTWTSSVSEQAEVAGNWSPVQVPAAADDLVWTGTGSLYCQFGLSAVQSSRSWTVTGQKTIHTLKAHTIAQGIRLTGNGFLTVSTLDSIVVNGDIENEGLGTVTIHQGCPVVGVDSVRFNNGLLHISGLNSRLLAQDVLMKGSLLVGQGARMVVSQSMTILSGAQITLSGATSSITAPALPVPFGSNLSLQQGRIQLSGELQLGGTMLPGNGALVEASTVRLSGNGAIAGNGTMAAPLVMEGASTGLTSASGKLTVGVASNPAGVLLDGTLLVESGSELECLSASPVVLPASVTVNHGTLRSASGFALGDGANMQAAGTIAGDIDVTGGELSVQYGTPRQLSIVGNWSQGSAARRTVYLIDSGGGWESDSIVVTGQAEPGGTLDIWYDDSAGSPANPIPFLFYASRPDQRVFDEVYLNGSPVTNELEIVYLGDRAQIVFAGAVAVDGPGRGPTLALSGRSGRSAALVLSLPGHSHVELVLYDVTGRALARVHDGPLTAGTHHFPLSGSRHAAGLASGVYFARAVVRDPQQASELRTAKVVVRR